MVKGAGLPRGLELPAQLVAGKKNPDKVRLCFDLIANGASYAQAARQCGVERGTVRVWVREVEDWVRETGWRPDEHDGDIAGVGERIRKLTKLFRESTDPRELAILNAELTKLIGDGQPDRKEVLQVNANLNPGSIADLMERIAERSKKIDQLKQLNPLLQNPDD